MSGFVDLRVNRQAGQVNESFWPSFTDIMTVVMMIFLIAMVVLLMRNMELVAELRNTMEAERLAAEQAAMTGAANQSLSMQLSEAQARIMQLQHELDDARSTAQLQQQRDQAVIAEQRSEIATLLTERADLAEQLALTNIVLDEQKQQLADILARIDGLQARLDNSTRQRDELTQQLARARQALTEAELDNKARIQQYTELSGRYDDLKVKYDKLVRPARSPKGRYVVEVRYRKAQGKPQIAYREPGKTDYRLLSRPDLDQRLAGLKQQHDEGLYIRIIIPDDSGLSYTEAWAFTKEILALYDYYYEGQQ
jgi:hypothetical protein